MATEDGEELFRVLLVFPFTVGGYDFDCILKVLKVLVNFRDGGAFY